VRATSPELTVLKLRRVMREAQDHPEKRRDPAWRDELNALLTPMLKADTNLAYGIARLAELEETLVSAGIASPRDLLGSPEEERESLADDELPELIRLLARMVRERLFRAAQERFTAKEIERQDDRRFSSPAEFLRFALAERARRGEDAHLRQELRKTQEKANELIRDLRPLLGRAGTQSASHRLPQYLIGAELMLVALHAELDARGEMLDRISLGHVIPEQAHEDESVSDHRLVDEMIDRFPDAKRGMLAATVEAEHPRHWAWLTHKERTAYAAKGIHNPTDRELAGAARKHLEQKVSQQRTRARKAAKQ